VLAGVELPPEPLPPDPPELGFAFDDESPDVLGFESPDEELDEDESADDESADEPVDDGVVESPDLAPTRESVR
jgi:hypothetical protein